MARVKVISEATDLVPLLRAFDSETKREVFDELTEGWVRESDVEDTYGEEGLEALGLLENAHLVETRWASGGESPEKAYRSFYTAFHLNVQSPVDEVGDLLHVATIPPEEFDEIEERLIKMADEDGVSTRRAQEELELTPAMLQGIVKRSSRLTVKGHQIVPRG